MKPISDMSDKEFEKYLKIIEPVLPIWCKDGAACSHYSYERFIDKAGNKAYVTTAHWKDKKGKKKESTAQVQWVDEWND